MQWRTLGLSGCRRAVVAVALVAAAACGGGGRRVGPVVTAPAPSPDAPGSPLEGEWTLRALELADGSTRRVTGFVRVDRFSNITLHAELQQDDPAARPPRLVVADFAGRAAIEDGRLTVVGLAVGVEAERLTPDAVPMDEWRYYELAGPALRISARDRAGRTGATLVFERVR